MNRISRLRSCVFVLLVAAGSLARAALPVEADSAEASALAEKADASVLKSLATRPKAEFLVVLGDEADLSAAAGMTDRVTRLQYVVDTLMRRAEVSQAPLRAWLAAKGVEHRAYWIANMIQVSGDVTLARSLAARGEVKRLIANPRANTLPDQSKLRREQDIADGQKSLSATASIEWGVAKINAPQLWALGITGAGIVIAGQDTGYDWTHPALKSKYRGWNGATVDHNYNWHDAIHAQINTTPGSNSCGFNSLVACDDDYHGTHTMGTMVGDDGAGNQIGVAPGAKWIGCRNMERGTGTRTTYVECFQWLLAPTNLANTNPDVSKAPHVINNSWGCPMQNHPFAEAGCETAASSDPIRIAIEALNAAGILVVTSAGNDGPACSTLRDAPAMYDASFSVGATLSSDELIYFSSRGPVVEVASNRSKPDVSAPGVSVRSSTPNGGYASTDGTSMAGPHVAGAAALLMQAYPSLIGNPMEIRRLLMRTAKRLPVTQNCDNLATTVPNNSTGWGRIDVLAAYNGAPGATLDVDSNTTGSPYNGTTDGLLILRHLLGLSTTGVTTNALSSSATLVDPVAVTARLAAIAPALDIDGDGQRYPHTDGLLVLRYLLGLRGAALTADISAVGAQRTSAPDIEAYLKLLTP